MNGSDQRLWTGGNSLPANQWSHYVATTTSEPANSAPTSTASWPCQPGGTLPNYGGELRLVTGAPNPRVAQAAPAMVASTTSSSRRRSAGRHLFLYAKGHATNEPVLGFNKELCDGIDNDCDAPPMRASTGNRDSPSDADLCNDNPRAVTRPATASAAAKARSPAGWMVPMMARPFWTPRARGQWHRTQRKLPIRRRLFQRLQCLRRHPGTQPPRRPELHRHAVGEASADLATGWRLGSAVAAAR